MTLLSVSYIQSKYAMGNSTFSKKLLNQYATIWF
jgi:hypothetical protein